MNADTKNAQPGGHVKLNGKTFKSIKSEYAEKEFVLISAWMELANEEENEIKVTKANMKKLKSDIEILGYTGLLVDGLGSVIKQKYHTLSNEARVNISQAELYRIVPFYLVINTHIDDSELLDFQDDMMKLGVKYHQQFVIYWNGTDPSNQYGAKIDLENVKEEFRKECQNFPDSEMD